MRLKFYFFTSLLFSGSFFLSACGFSRLTAVHDNDTRAPGAVECGSCHVLQYEEWKSSAHARATISPAFREQAREYDPEDCLGCHQPGTVFDKDPSVRSYNRDEGVTCISCHLCGESMHGPFFSGAVATPHAIDQDNRFDPHSPESAALCGRCHQETYNRWQQHSVNQVPTCLVCHGAPVRRSVTQGTNFFSRMLVFFESVHSGYSHAMSLPDPTRTTALPKLQTCILPDGTLSFILINTLPHDLPTGSYGEKDFFFSIRQHGVPVKKVALGTPLASGGQRIFTVQLPAARQRQPVTIALYRRQHPDNTVSLVILRKVLPLHCDSK